MRKITAHQTNDCNKGITITALDGPGPGGASHHYRLEFDDPKWGPDKQSIHQTHEIYFQNGPIKEVGTNGLTQEALLAIVIDRLQGFQSGPFACEKNKCALELVQNALQVLQERTAERVDRGVEGTLQP